MRLQGEVRVGDCVWVALVLFSVAHVSQVTTMLLEHCLVVGAWSVFISRNLVVDYHTSTLLRQ